MKNILITGILMLLTTPLFGQTDIDALRASQKIYSGTARFQSMGGAFNSLGGDFSSIPMNPAGLGVYRSSELSFSPSFYYNSSTASYRNGQNEDLENNFSINNLGLVLSFPVSNDDWKTVNLAFGFNRHNTFDQNIFFSSDDEQGSLLDEFTNYANTDMGNYFFEGMALATGVLFFSNHDEFGNLYREFNPTDDEINNVPSLIDGYFYDNDFGFFQELNGLDHPVYGHYLEKRFQRTGKSSEFDFSIGSNYKNRLYIGGGIGVTRFSHEARIEHIENTVNSDFESTLYSDDDYFTEFAFTQNYLAYGTGVNFKAGVIVRPVDFLRIGAAIHSPTIQRIETEFSTSMDALFITGEENREFSDLGVNEYTVYTPFKLQTGISFQIEKYALISFDYEYIDYSKMKFKSDDYNFSQENTAIDTKYDVTHNLRAGAEVRLGSVFLRGGYAYYDNPFKTDDLDDISLQQYSGGLGVMINSVKIDFGYIYQAQNEGLTAYEYSPVANIESITNQYVATIAFRF